MAITKYESAMDPNLTSHGHSRSDPGVMSLSQASVHLREYQTRIDEANSRERKAKRSNLSAAATAFEISAFLAQHNRDLCRDLSVNIEGPVLPFFVHDSSNPTFEARLQAAISSDYGASFVLHHRLLSYYLYSARFADIITHIETYNRIEYGLITNVEWTRWCERFCTGLVERHFECRFESYSADLTDDMRKKYVSLEDVNIFDLLILRLRLMGQRNSLETEFSTISEFSELCEAHSRAIDATQAHMEELFKESFYERRDEEWSHWKTEMQQTNSSQKWRAFLRLSAVAADPSSLVQQAWDWLVQSFDHADFMHIERWSLDSNFDSAPHFAEFSSPIQLARLTRFSEDCKFAHLLLSSTTASGKNKEASKKYAKFVLAVPPPSNLSGNFFLSVAIKCDMILLARAREVREWSWVQNKLFFYFEFSRHHAIPMILDFLVHMGAPENRSYPILADLIAFITLQKTDDKRGVLPWSSPLLPWVELIKQPFFDVTPISNNNDQRTWTALLDAIADGTSPQLPSDLEASVDGSLSTSSSNGILSTPARKTRTSILTPSLGTPGGARNFLTPQRSRVGLSQPATPAPSENKASKVVLNVQGSTLSGDLNSFFAKQIKRSELKILGALAAHDPTTISDISGMTNTLLSLLEWAASRYDVAKKSGLKLSPSSIASHVVAALNVDTFFVAISLPTVSESEQSTLESASILVIDSLLRSVSVEQLPTSLYETLLKHSSTMQDNANAALLSAELWSLIAIREGEDSSAHKHLISNLERAEKLFESGRSQRDRAIFTDFESRIARLKSSAPSQLATPASSKASSNLSSLQTPGKMPNKSLFAQPAAVEPESAKSLLSEEQLQQAFVSRLRRGLAKVTMTQQTPIQIDDFELDYLRPFSPSTSSPAETLSSLVPSNISTPSTPADTKKKLDTTFSSLSTPVSQATAQSTPAPSPFSKPFSNGATPAEEKPEPIVATPSFKPASAATSAPAPATPVAATMTDADKEAIKRQLRAEMEAEIAKEKASLQAQREDLERDRKLFQLSKDSAKKEDEKKRNAFQQMRQEHERAIAAEAAEMERRLASESLSDDESSSSSSSSSSEDESDAKVKATPVVSVYTKPDEPPRRTSPRAHPLVPKMVFNSGKAHTFGTKTSPTGSAQTSPTTPTSANSLPMQGSAVSAHSNDSSPTSAGTVDSSTSASSTKAWTPLPKNAYSFGSKTTASTQSPAFLGRTAANNGTNGEEKAAEPRVERERASSLPKSAFGFGGSSIAKNSGFGFNAKPVASIPEESKPVATPTAASVAATSSAPVSTTTASTAPAPAVASSTVSAPLTAETKVEAKNEEAEPAKNTEPKFGGFGAFTPAPSKTAWNTAPAKTSFGFGAKPAASVESKAVETIVEKTEDKPSVDAPDAISAAATAPATTDSKPTETMTEEKPAPAATNSGFGQAKSFGFGTSAPKTSFGAGAPKPAGFVPPKFGTSTPVAAAPTATPSADSQKPEGMSDAEWAEVRPKPVNAATSAFMSGASKPAVVAAPKFGTSSSALSSDPQKPEGMSEPVNAATSAFMSGASKPAASTSTDPQKPEGMSDAEWAEVRPKPVNAATSAFMSGASKPAVVAAPIGFSHPTTAATTSKPAEGPTDAQVHAKFQPQAGAVPANPNLLAGAKKSSGAFTTGSSSSTPTVAFKGFTPSKPKTTAATPTSATASSDPQKPEGMSDAEWAEVRPKPVNAATSAFMSGASKPAGFVPPKFGTSTPVATAPTYALASDSQKPEGMSDAEWAEVRPKPVNAATSAFMSGAFKPASASTDPQKPEGMSDAEWAEVRPKPVNAATSAFMSGASKPATSFAAPAATDSKPTETTTEEKPAPAPTTFGFGQGKPFGFGASTSFGAKPTTSTTTAASDPQKPEGMSDAEWAEVRPKPVNAATSAFMSGASKPAAVAAPKFDTSSSAPSSDPQKPEGMSDAEWAEVRPKPVNAATSAFMSGSSKPATTESKPTTTPATSFGKPTFSFGKPAFGATAATTAPEAKQQEESPESSPQASTTADAQDAPSTSTPEKKSPFGFGKPSFGSFGTGSSFGTPKLSFGAKPAAVPTPTAPAAELLANTSDSPASPTESTEEKSSTNESPVEAKSTDSAPEAAPEASPEAVPETAEPTKEDEQKEETEPSSTEDKDAQPSSPTKPATPTPEVTSNETSDKAEELEASSEKSKDEKDEEKPATGFSAAAQAAKTAFSLSPTPSQGKSTFGWNPTPTTTKPAGNFGTFGFAKPTTATPATSDSPALATTPQFAAAPPVAKTFGFGAGATFAKAAAAVNNNASPSTPTIEPSTPGAEMASPAKPSFSLAAGIVKPDFKPKFTGFQAPATTTTEFKPKFDGFKAPTTTATEFKPKFTGFKAPTDATTATTATTAPTVVEDEKKTTETSEPSEAPKPTSEAPKSSSNPTPKGQMSAWREPSPDDDEDDESWANDGDDDDDDAKPATPTAKKQLSSLLKASIDDEDDIMTDEEQDSTDEDDVDDEPKSPAPKSALAAAGGFSDDDDEEDDFMVDDDAPSSKSDSPKAKPSNSLKSALAAAGGFGDSDDDDFGLEDDISTPKSNNLQSALAAAGGFGDSDDEDFSVEDDAPKSPEPKSNALLAAIENSGGFGDDEDDFFDDASPAATPKSNALQAALSSMGGFDDANDDFDMVSDSESEKQDETDKDDSKPLSDLLSAALDSAGFEDDDGDF